MKSIKIPVANSIEYVEIFPDELPEDVNDVLDVLKAELAPLKIWRAVAVEYYRQGEYQNFEAVLSEIVSTMQQDPTVEQYYREKGEYKEGIVEIFDALAAYALDRSVKSIGEIERKKEVADYIQKAESINQRNEYTWLIKGFFELAFGNIDNAEYSLKNVYERATAKSSVQRSDKNLSSHVDKKIFLFASLLGLGTLSFIRKKYSLALEYFSKALHQNSKCGANVRVAIASCTFKLEQYDRTRSALDRALTLDPTNVDALVLLSLVERVESQKADKKKRHEYRALANELCTLAAHIDPSCAMALNHLANYSFYQWKLVHPSGFISTSKLIILNPINNNSLGTLTLKDGDMIQIQKAFVTTVSSVIKVDNTYEITLETDVPHEWIGQSTFVEMKDISKINEVKTLTTRALRASNNPNIKAESFYIFGRLYHMIRDYDIAFQLYEEALNLQPDMPLASFGLGQLYMAKQDYALALEKFNSVLLRHPDDRDTQAYVMLLQSIHKKESAPFDKLREIAPGFAFEADLWLSQGHTIQMKGPGEYQAALKCYEMAYECMIKQNLTPQSKMLLNMGILYHSLGNLTTANDFVRRSLSPELLIIDETKINPIFHRPENDIFYKWSNDDDIQLYVQIIDNENNILDNEINILIDNELKISSYQLIKLIISNNNSNINSFLNYIQIGNDILVSDILMEVLYVTSDYIICKGFHSTLKRNISHKISIKKPEFNFNNSTLTNCFTLARIQEDRGHIQAAREIYIELLKLRPTFIECYLRLSLMAKEIGKFHEANHWVSMALEIDPNHADSIIVQGDLAALSEKWDLAKSKYEKICKERHHDARALLSLGNIYYATASVKESSIKDSMKFYHTVLKEDHRNIYAANGLGMVCASKEQNEIARDIFSRVRETGLSPASDVCVNLGHMHLTQGRFVDAIHIYLASLKSLPLSPAVRLQSEIMTDVSDCLALAYLKNSQHDDSIRIILKSIHYDPSNLHVWFNLACVKEELAVKLCKTIPGSISDITIAIEELEHATILFKSLKASSICPGVKQHELLQVHKAGQHEKFCLDGIEKAKNKLYKAQVETERKEQIRLKQVEENRQRLASKQAEKLKEEEAKKLSRLEQQELAKQKEREFEELRKTWVTTSTSEKKTDKKRKKQSKNSTQEEEDGDLQESGENNNEQKSGYVFSDSEPEAQDQLSDNEADIFGSSSEDENDNENNINTNKKVDNNSKKKNLITNKNIGLYDSDDDNNNDDGNGNNDIFNDSIPSQSNGNLKGKRSANEMSDELNVDDEVLFESSGDNLPQKQRRIIDDEDDDEDGNNIEAEADF